MLAQFSYGTTKEGLLGTRRAFVIIDAQEGEKLTPEEATVILLDKIDTWLERVERNTK